MPKSQNVALIGPNGQVGRAIQELMPEATPIGRDQADLSVPTNLHDIDFSGYDTIINCAAYTKVDQAEDDPDSAQAINSTVPGVLAEIAERNGAILVHFSTDYVFDGKQVLHTEDEAPNPLSVYGVTKRIGDLMALQYKQTYDIRTSWVIGDGVNFARTMLRLASQGATPGVVDDQFGRPSFASEIARATAHLLSERPNPGLYNLSSDGDRTTWFNIAEKVFELAGAHRENVTPTDTVTFFGDKPHAHRPVHSTLDLSKIMGTGFTPNDWNDDLEKYVLAELENTL